MKRTRNSPDKGQRKLSCFFRKVPNSEAVLKDLGNTVKVTKKDECRTESNKGPKVAPNGGEDCVDKSVTLPVCPKKVTARSDGVSDSGVIAGHPKEITTTGAFDSFDDMSFSSLEHLDANKENCDLKLDELQRCEVQSVTHNAKNELVVKLISLKNSLSAICKIQSPWSLCTISVGDIVSVRAAWKNGEWTVDSSCLLVLHSDNLISGTSIVGSLFCKRRSVLGGMVKDSSVSPVMVVGSLVHELLQEVLKQNLRTLNEIGSLLERTVSSKDFAYRLYSEGMEYQKTVDELSNYVPQMHKFVQRYLGNNGGIVKGFRDDSWTGEISSVEDIEECVWAPSLGVKGKIDATIKVKINKVSKIMPLELKTGRASFSTEHRGQVILYCMLLSHLGHKVDSGLLLYLREGIMKEVRAGDAEKRDLIALRNEFAHWLAESSRPNFGGVPSLPPPIDHHAACGKCPFLTVCSSALRLDGVESLKGSNPLKALIPEATAHLTDAHLEYVFNFMSLVLIEKTQGLMPLWAESHDAREAKGMGIANLLVEKVVERGTRFEHVFVKIDGSKIREDALKEDQYIVVDTDSRYGITSGFVCEIQSSKLTVLLDRNIIDTPGPFHVDRLASSSQNTIPLSNLALLLNDSKQAASLRKSIIDLKVPKFATKLSSKIAKVGARIFEGLNRDQKKAILQVLSAESYILIEGMPGTGKTSTIVALVELLTALGQSVLVTSYTHSALDNILLKLVGRVDFLRLGSSGRVHPDILPHSEEVLLQGIETGGRLEDLKRLYESKPVIGVTCLGSWHFLLNKRNFDFCIVDEATQAHQPVVLKPLFSAAKFILIGDPKQLSPLIHSNQAREKGLGVSLYERLNRPAVTSHLTLQYRMNGNILKLANGLTYDGKLKCANSEVENASLKYEDTDSDTNWPEWLKTCMSKELDNSVVVLDVKNSSPTSENNINVEEANVVIRILRTFNEVGMNGKDIGVMAPYLDQVDYLERNVSKIDPSLEVKTIDKYQGRDKLVMLYSCTRFLKPTPSDIMNDSSRLTVAVTRAKVKIIIIGDIDLLRCYKVYNKLFQLIPQDNFFKVM